MKRVLLLLLIVSLCLSGCSAKENTAPHSHEDLTIRIPADYIDLSGEEYAQDLTFIYGLAPVTVSGLRDDKSMFTEFNLDLNGYGQLILDLNNISSQLTEKDGIPTFTYEANGYTYLVTLWETESAYWTVQAYCPTTDFEAAKDQMWEILTSIKIL